MIEMVWNTSKGGRVYLRLPDDSEVADVVDIDMAEECIALQLKTWRRAMTQQIAARWPFPVASVDRKAQSDG